MIVKVNYVGSDIKYFQTGVVDSDMVESDLNKEKTTKYFYFVDENSDHEIYDGIDHCDTLENKIASVQVLTDAGFMLEEYKY